MFVSLTVFGQVKVHSHNDYEQKIPFLMAYNTGVYEMEADVFLVGDSLVVAHTKKAINPAKTLNKLYLDPIASLFKRYKGMVSADNSYTFSLMIDIKENWEEIYPVLKREIEKYGDIFDRSKSKLAIQIVISGARPAESTFHTYPTWLFFDGLPTLNYPKKDLQRVTMISDNFRSYSKWDGNGEIPTADKLKFKEVIAHAKKVNKMCRFWGGPDTLDCWQQLAQLGATIINTDKINECQTYFEQHK